ncbi:MAG: glycosyltransferase family 2 protein [Pseudomonadota bacterium]|nr:glycosyltransferase family 2 protein [Pseudomonadota bacterium]
MSALCNEPAAAAPRLLVIIVNYRTADLVIDCLESLLEGVTLPSDGAVIVADGASGDGSVERLQSAIAAHGWQQRAHLLALETNLGFSHANNCAYAHACSALGKPRHVLFLNPDTVVRPNGLRPLLEFVESHPPVGIAGARLEDPDGTPQACAFRFPSILGEFESEAKLGPVSKVLGKWQVAASTGEDPVRVDWVSGAAMLVRSELLDEVGLLDESYFLYYEEVDFCRRAAAAGWQCWHVPQSRIVHLVGCSTGVTKHRAPARRPRYWFASRDRFFSQHHGRRYARWANIAWIAGHLVFRLRLLVERKMFAGPPHLLADFLLHSLGIRSGHLETPAQ